ncbi:MAG: ParB/RepB/Spo0J family partition protein [Clostridiaceae bacterium]|nr:ParB/RepB/Spo0J family partition protein [Clostridiaceae bacterium]
MAKNTGLGKGLDALFSNKSIIEEVKDDKKEGQKIEIIKIIDIEPNKDQPRRNFDMEAIEELAESIKIYGVIQPIIVNKRDGYYEIVAGERRWRASKKAGLTEIPCIIRNDDERKTKEIALIENIQREDLNPIEKAKGFKQLIDEYGLKQQELADIMGMNRSTVTNCLRILNLDSKVIDLALEGKLTEGHCRSLLGYDDPEMQYKMALKIIETGQTVRDIERNLKNKKNVEKNTKEMKKKYEAIYRDIENRFQGFFGTKVKLDAGVKSGKIIIKYSSNDDLERILDLINK